MKQRIRGLVSLHEIPFSSRTLQREEGNWPHYRKSKREGGVEGAEGGERWSRNRLCSCFRSTALHDCCPTCDTTFINTGSLFFLLCLFFTRENEEKVKKIGDRRD